MKNVFMVSSRERAWTQPPHTRRAHKLRSRLLYTVQMMKLAIVREINCAYLRKVWNAGRLSCRDLLLRLPTKAKESLLRGRLNGIRHEILIVLGADKARIAILLQQQRVDVLGCNVEGESWRGLEALLDLLHCLAIDVDLAGCARLEEFSVEARRRRIIYGSSII